MICILFKKRLILSFILLLTLNSYIMKSILLLTAGFVLGYIAYRNREKIKEIFSSSKSSETSDTEKQTSVETN